MPRRVRLITAAVAALLLLTLGASAASASRAPTRAESAAIKKGFFKLHSKSTTKITRIRVSTVDKRFSSVTYTKNVREPVVPSAKAATAYKPQPIVLKKSAGKWKGPAKAPTKVKNDLKLKAATSRVVLSGDIDAILTQPARCDLSNGSVSIYDKARDLYFSVQFHGTGAWKGPGFYPALAARSVVGIYTNSGTVLAYETGQPSDAFSPSGEFFVDRGWGFIGARMAPPTGAGAPLSVSAAGTWNCGL